jgi:hypothetical protein
LAIYNLKASDFSQDWMSKNIIKFTLIERLAGHFNNIDEIKKLKSIGTPTSEIREMGNNILNDIYVRPLGERIYGLYKLDDSKYDLYKMYQSFIDHDDIQDFACVLIDKAFRVDGRYKNKADIAYHSVACILSFLLDKNDIDHSDIKGLCNAGMISRKSLFETDHYHKYQAPVVTQQDVDEYKLIHRGDTPAPWSSIVIFEKIKENLTKKEMLGYCLGNNSQNVDTTWRNAMIKYAAITGEIITMKEAMALDPSQFFDIYRTQAYSDYVDTHNDPSEWDSVNLSMETAPYRVDGKEKYYEVSVSSKYFYYDDAIEILKDNINSENFYDINYCNPGLAILSFKFDSLSAKETKSRFFEINKNIVKAMNIIKNTHLAVGDIAEVVDNEASGESADECIGVKSGHKGLVTAIRKDCCKFQGSKKWIDSDFLKISAKFNPINELEKSHS